jgi:hypothetical protein
MLRTVFLIFACFFRVFSYSPSALSYTRTSKWWMIGNESQTHIRGTEEARIKAGAKEAGECSKPRMRRMCLMTLCRPCGYQMCTRRDLQAAPPHSLMLSSSALSTCTNTYDCNSYWHRYLLYCRSCCHRHLLSLLPPFGFLCLSLTPSTTHLAQPPKTLKEPPSPVHPRKEDELFLLAASNLRSRTSLFFYLPVSLFLLLTTEKELNSGNGKLTKL